MARRRIRQKRKRPPKEMKPKISDKMVTDFIDRIHNWARYRQKQAPSWEIILEETFGYDLAKFPEENLREQFIHAREISHRNVYALILKNEEIFARLVLHARRQNKKIMTKFPYNII